MDVRCGPRLAVWICVPLWMLSGSPALAGVDAAEGPGLFERIENTTQQVGNRIGEGFTKVAKKIEQNNVVEKVEGKLKKAVTKTEEGLKKAGKKIDQKLNH